MEIKYLFNFIFFLFSLLAYFIIFFKRKKIALNLGIMDYPNIKRKIHKDPTPKTAAFSVFVTLTFFLIINIFFNVYNSSLNTIFLISILFYLIGFIDDKYNLSPYKKLFLTFVIIISVVGLNDNFLITKIYLQTYDTFYQLNNFSLVFTAFAIILLINSFNLADGINGLSIGIFCFWLFFFLIKKFNSDFNILIIIIFLISLIAFFHSYQGKHFLGDGGSLMLPSIISFFVIYETNVSIQKEQLPLSAEQLFILFWLPGIDMLRLFIERIIKKDPFDGDQNHFHHYLIQKYSLINSLYIFFTTMITPIILIWIFNINALLIIILTILFYFFLIIYLRR